MVAIAERGEKMAVRKGYMNVWQTTLMEAVKADCSYCLLSAVCSQCVSFDLRKRALHNKLSRYVCCAGYMPCSGKCQEDKCPTFCLCMEVFCCLSNSVASTRFLLQDEYNIQTTECDNCLIAFMIILGQVACICRLLACLTGNDELQEIAEILTCISDLVYCTVCACMQTQHKVELDHRHRMPGSGVMTVPAVQEMSRFDQPVPPNVTQPPQGQYPPTQYPPGQYPPQQGQWQQQQPPYGYAYPPGPPPPYMQGYHPNAMPPPGYYPPNVPPQPQHFPSGEHPNNPPAPPAPKDSA
ncbi:uncharacterized protein LOC120188683 [Hibiscus syriacus]|uniref:uncharacterized protein LOC120188683 n=1 Tax=Hibiscus syriacus TaxID=106335 RepID=UPI0019226EB0|nr:uncharacterized protein LOC120188683 [Hibiscus syriacus]